jgi:hypothetical protein
MSARQDATRLTLSLEPGLDTNTRLQLWWPNRRRPAHVTIDGKTQQDFTADYINVDQPFRELIAQW